MIFVSEAGWRGASGAAACSTAPLLASTTMAAYGGLYADEIEVSLPCERLWRRRASAESVVTASIARMAARLRHPQRSLREAPTGTQYMMIFPRSQPGLASGRAPRTPVLSNSAGLA